MVDFLDQTVIILGNLSLHNIEKYVLHVLFFFFVVIEIIFIFRIKAWV